MDFSLNSSVVLAAIVGLWLVWVVPFFLRRSGPVPAPAAASTPTAGEHPPQGSIMEKTATAGSASAHRTGSSAVPGRRPALKIRRGRAAVALVGAAALPAALVTLVLAVISVVSFWWPVAAVLIVAAAVATLRTLAVRDRRARVNAAFAAAMSSRPLHQAPPSTGDAVLPGTATPEAGGKPAPVRPTTVFDAEKPAGAIEASAGTPETPAARLTAADLKAAALAVAAAGVPVADAPAASTQAPVPGTDPWEPVEVPLPTYVAAEKAQRSAPAPLELPAEPKPTVRTPIKNSAPKAAKEAAAPAPAGTRLNLDDVLQRRRA
ncbi:hypothetical protein [Arthrobacter zhaoguopingii]|uniref:hypothetical protein n=1 Tax=Arthrobacter zhaoguopingii TaxID=2681491 RepID=UPI0013577619|nr:hypothetical protein [Arthrobacter zhaoguopingii]